MQASIPIALLAPALDGTTRTQNLVISRHQFVSNLRGPEVTGGFSNHLGRVQAKTFGKGLVDRDVTPFLVLHPGNEWQAVQQDFLRGLQASRTMFGEKRRVDFNAGQADP